MRLRQMLKSKIHRATVTEADVNYTGSITIDSELVAPKQILVDERNRYLKEL
jgi:aspartate 1-decarboxylase